MPIYFVQQINFVKIGYSNNPAKRISGLQTANPQKLETLLIMPGNAAVERELHSVFSDYHHLNEWYYFEGVVKSFVDAAAPIFREYTNQYQKGGEYQDDRDWEYWKARALKAEGELLNKGRTLLVGLPTDWRQLSRQQKHELAHATREERENMFPELASRTRREWHNRLDKVAAQNGSYIGATK